ncbi:MAG: patatin family protein [Ruminiclostridium sp.]|nr:patatin family protein [Ruminiclostridium sp.]
MNKKIYKDLDKLPTGRADNNITDGCLVLEGGGWKGLYTVGVLDCMMLNGINISSVIGVSAGALSAIGYVSGQIGWSARIDLTYRHDTNYCGLGAMRRDGGVTGFTYLFNDILKALPLDEERLMSPSRKLAVTATDLLSGRITYFEKGKCDIFRAIQASATVPYVSRPVMINGVPYLDGGCAEKIPYSRVERSGRKNVVAVRTRELSFRRKPGAPKAAKLWYGKYPEFVKSLESANENFNATADKLEQKAKEGSVFLIAPSKPVEVTRFDGDMDKLGALYWLGFNDMERRVGELREYLGM